MFFGKIHLVTAASFVTDQLMCDNEPDLYTMNHGVHRQPQGIVSAQKGALPRYGTAHFPGRSLRLLTDARKDKIPSTKSERTHFADAVRTDEHLCARQDIFNKVYFTASSASYAYLSNYTLRMYPALPTD